MPAKLNSNQQAFAKRLSADTGLSLAVCQAWCLAEEPASASSAPNGANNWLNIGAFDSGNWAGGGASVWDSPVSAADATASFILGRPVNGQRAPMGASPGIRAIANSAGQSAAAQVSAIQNSGWATSHYPDLPSLLSSVGGGISISPDGTTGGASGAGGSALGTVLSGLEAVPGFAGVAVVAGGVLLLAVGLWAAGGFRV